MEGVRKMRADALKKAVLYQLTQTVAIYKGMTSTNKSMVHVIMDLSTAEKVVLDASLELLHRHVEKYARFVYDGVLMTKGPHYPHRRICLDIVYGDESVHMEAAIKYRSERYKNPPLKDFMTKVFPEIKTDDWDGLERFIQNKALINETREKMIADSPIMGREMLLENANRISRKIRTCHGCGDQTIGIKSCGGCKKVYYCDRACQKRDWKNHKIKCLNLI